MSGFSRSINFARLARAPKRLIDDVKIFQLVKNWREVWSAKLDGRSVRKISLRNGAVLEAPPEASLLFLFHEIWVDKVYELPGFEIAEGDLVIDIGGNVGLFTVFAATRARDVRVFSYEPFPENAAFLRRNVSGNRLENVTIYDEAVAGGSGERFLQIDASWIKHSLADSDAETSGMRVPCIGLDEVLRRAGHCDLLKVDCEGGEYEIFYNAAADTLRAIDKIVCEYHDSRNGTGVELRGFLEANGFVTEIARSFDETTGVLCLRNRR